MSAFGSRARRVEGAVCLSHWEVPKLHAAVAGIAEAALTAVADIITDAVTRGDTFMNFAAAWPSDKETRPPDHLDLNVSIPIGESEDEPLILRFNLRDAVRHDPAFRDLDIEDRIAVTNALRGLADDIDGGLV